MSKPTDLTYLLTHLRPELQEGAFVFVSVSSLEGIAAGDILGSFREKEGWSLILEKSRADQLGLGYDYVAAWISLQVHSSLEAVGLTAAVATHLAKAGISCNVVAAFHHDHIFVAESDGTRALQLLKALSDATHQ